jgi:hypothetical protein
MPLSSSSFFLLLLLLPAAASHLDLTRFVRSGDHAAAQAAARVRLPDDPLNLTSYSGFVETTPGRHMFMYVLYYFITDRPLLRTILSDSFGPFRSLSGPFGTFRDLSGLLGPSLRCCIAASEKTTPSLVLCALSLSLLILVSYSCCCCCCCCCCCSQCIARASIQDEREMLHSVGHCIVTSTHTTHTTHTRHTHTPRTACYIFCPPEVFNYLQAGSEKWARSTSMPERSSTLVMAVL